MIKVTRLEIKSAENAMKKITGIPAEFKSAYWVSRLIKRLDSEMNTMEHARINLIDKYGKKDEKGGSQVPPENMAAFNEEYIKLLQVEVEIDMPLIKFDYIKNLRMSADDILVLEKFVEDIEKAMEAPAETK